MKGIGVVLFDRRPEGIARCLAAAVSCCHCSGERRECFVGRGWSGLGGRSPAPKPLDYWSTLYRLCTYIFVRVRPPNRFDGGHFGARWWYVAVERTDLTCVCVSTFAGGVFLFCFFFLASSGAEGLICVCFIYPRLPTWRAGHERCRCFAPAMTAFVEQMETTSEL